MSNPFSAPLSFMEQAIPADEVEELRKMVQWALDNGWTKLGLWTGLEPADITDLVGIPPGSRTVAFVSHYFEE